MALSTGTLSGDLADLLGNDFDSRRTKVWITTNVPGDTLVDKDGNKVRLGSGVIPFAADGTFSASVWLPGADGNPTSWQTYVNVSYPDPGSRSRVLRAFGPFTITASSNLADLIAEQEVPPTYLSAVTAQLDTYVDAAEGHATAAQTARVGAEAARDEAQALVLSDLGTTDGQTRALIENPASQTSAALTASTDARILTTGRGIYLPRSSNRVAFLGDSIAGFNGSGDNVATFENNNENWTGYTSVRSMGRIEYARAFSDPSKTIAEIRTLGLQRLLAVPTLEKPGTCVILAGTNDVGTGASFNLSASGAAYAGICDDLMAAGIRPVVCTIPPRGGAGDTDTVRNNVAKLNAWLQMFASRRGYPLIDLNKALSNPATGGFTTATNADGIHPGVGGMLAMADAALASDWYRQLPARAPDLTTAWTDTSNLIPSGQGLFLNGLNGSNVPIGMNGGGGSGATVSIVDPVTADGLLGKWAQVSRPSGGTGGAYFLQFVITLGAFATVGDLLTLDCRLQVTGLDTAGAYATAGGVSVGLQLADSSNTDTDATLMGFGRSVDGVVHLERRVRADTNRVKFTLSVAAPTTGTAVAKIGQITIRNRTALDSAA